MAAEQKISLKKTMTEFLNSTSVTAIPHAMGAYFICFKFLWFAIFCGGLAATFLHFYFVIDSFLQYKTQVKVSLQHKDKIEFPGVTVCNLNPVKWSTAACSDLAQIVDIEARLAKKVQENPAVNHLHEEHLETGKTNLELRQWLRNTMELTNSHECSNETETSYHHVDAYSDLNAAAGYASYAENENLNQKTASPTTTDATISTENQDFDVYYDNELFGDERFTGDKFGFAKFVHWSKLADLQDVRDVFTFSPEMQSMGCRADDFLTECTFDRTSCNYTNFENIINRKYGNCYAFNQVLDKNSTVHETRRTGSEYGLSLTLNIQADQYVGLLAPAYGAKISVHDARVPAIPEDDGFVAAPGFLTSVALTRKEIHRLKAPFESNCTAGLHYSNFNHPSGAYSMRLCELACRDSVLYEKCNCVEQEYNVQRSMPRCDIYDGRTRKCQARVMSQMILPADHPDSLFCDCPTKCHEILYDTQISVAKWPTVPYQKLKMANFLGEHTLARQLFEQQLRDDRDMEDWVAQNLVRIHIYYQTSIFEVISEQEAYPLCRLWADLGGVAGLYLGMSAVTACEAVQLFLLLILGCCKAGEQQIEPDVQKIYGTKRPLR